MAKDIIEVLAEATAQKIKEQREEEGVLAGLPEIWTTPAKAKKLIDKLIGAGGPPVAGPADELLELYYGPLVIKDTVGGNFLDWLSVGYLVPEAYNFFGRLIAAGDNEVNAMRKDFSDYMGIYGKDIHERIISQLTHYKALKEYENLVEEKEPSPTTYHIGYEKGKITFTGPPGSPPPGIAVSIGRYGFEDSEDSMTKEEYEASIQEGKIKELDEYDKIAYA